MKLSKRKKSFAEKKISYNVSYKTEFIKAWTGLWAEEKTGTGLRAQDTLGYVYHIWESKRNSTNNQRGKPHVSARE